MLQLDRLHIRQSGFDLRAHLQFQPGRITAMIGPSGAGKSTLLSCIGGFIAESSGSIICNEADISPLPPQKRPIAGLFQAHNLFPHLNIRDNLGLALRTDLRLSKADTARIDDSLTAVGLQGFAVKMPGQMSGGEQSRAALARVLLQDRDIILLDEPFAALGPKMKRDMLDLVRSTLMRENRVIILVTHDPSDVRQAADDVVIVGNGTVSPPALTDEVMQHPPEILRHYL